MAFDFKRFPELHNAQLELYYFDSPHVQITSDFDAKCVRVIDGDTIRVTTSFRDFEFPVRFSNILAPETDERGGESSKQFMKNRIEGKNIEVIVNPENRVGKWGRLLGEIRESGFDVGEESIANGHSIGLDEERGDIQGLVIERFIL